MFQDESLKLFQKYLEDRLETNIHLTEDSVRYSFFSALTAQNAFEQHEITLELPHPQIKNAEIDTYIKSKNIEAFLEFKYHRKSNSTSPKPQKAGSLFKDFIRLSSLNGSAKKYVVYFTDSEMATYFHKHNSQYSDFWSKQSFEFDDIFLSKTTSTFKKVCGNVVDCKIQTVFSSCLATGHEIRVYCVTAI